MTRLSFVFGGSYGSMIVDNSIRTDPVTPVVFSTLKNDVLACMDQLPLGIIISSSNELREGINQNTEVIKYIFNTTGFAGDDNVSLSSYKYSHTLCCITIANNRKLVEFIVINSCNNDVKSGAIKIETNLKVDSMLDLEEFNEENPYLFYSLENLCETTMIFVEKGVKTSISAELLWKLKDNCYKKHIKI